MPRIGIMGSAHAMLDITEFMVDTDAVKYLKVGTYAKGHILFQ